MEIELLKYGLLSALKNLPICPGKKNLCVHELGGVYNWPFQSTQWSVKAKSWGSAPFGPYMGTHI